MEEIINAIALVLATWRVTSIINREKIAYPIRKLIGEKIDYGSGMTSAPDTFIANLITCFMCLSVWVSIGILVLFHFFPPAIYVFALSGAAIFVERKLYG